MDVEKRRYGSWPVTALCIAFAMGGCGCQPEAPLRSGTTPTVVGPGVISTEAVEHNAAFTPDGRTLYFTRTSGRWGGGGHSRIYRTDRANGSWSAPAPMPFSGEFADSDASVSPDGSTLYFKSDRPVPDGSSQGTDIWAYDLTGEGDVGPRHVDGVNSPADEYSPVMTSSGRLYFASAREGGRGQGDLYVASPSATGFDSVRNLGPAVNGPSGEWNLVVDPDERFLIFEASGRALNRSNPGDLYVSWSRGGQWTPGVPLDAINTTGSDLMPKLSPDGDVLYFSSSMDAGQDHTDVFQVDLASLLEAAGERPREVLVAVSRSAHEIVLIDPQTLSVTDRIDVGMGPHEAAATDGGLVIVPNYGMYPTPHPAPVESHPGWDEVPEGNSLSFVEVSRGESATTLILPECRRTHGVQAGRAGALAWITCEDEEVVLEIDLSGPTIARSWPTGQGGSHRVIATANDRYLTVANVEAGTVSVIDRTDESTTVLPTGQGSEGLAEGANGTVWVAVSGEDALVQIDPAASSIVRSLPTGGRFPIAVSVDRERREAWIAHMGTRSIDVLDLETGERTGRVTFNSAPLRVLVIPESRHAYVSLPRKNAVAVIDRSTLSEIGRVEGIMEVDGLAWGTISPDTAVRN